MNNTNIIRTEEIQKNNVYILDALQEQDYETKMGKLEHRRSVLLSKIQENELEIEKIVPYRQKNAAATVLLIIFLILFLPMGLVIFGMSVESSIKSKTYFMGLIEYLIFSAIFIAQMSILPLVFSIYGKKKASPGGTFHTSYYNNEILQIERDKNELQALEETIALEKKAVRENE